MKPLIICALSFVMLSGCSAKPQSGPNLTSETTETNSEWKLVWSDEFDDQGLDRSKWAPEVSCWGGGNEERQCYTDRPENIEVTDGVLKLKAFKGSFTGPQYPKGHPDYPGGTESRPYTSGKIRTRKLAAWTYGRFEARMKLSTGQGAWPAFWMLSDDDSYGTWPLSGEIDILEAVNLGATCDECDGEEGENRTIAALHFGEKWPKNTFLDARYKLPGGPNAKEDYHVFAVEWSAGQIDWFVDGEKYYSLSSEDWFTAGVGKDTNSNAPFDKPFYIMFNLAVGGGLSEGNNEMTFDPKSFPSETLVDWVRVYECAIDPVTGRACMGRK